MGTSGSNEVGRRFTPVVTTTSPGVFPAVAPRPLVPAFLSGFAKSGHHAATKQPGVSDIVAQSPPGVLAVLFAGATGARLLLEGMMG